MPTVEDFLESAGMVAVINGAIFLIGRAAIRSMKLKGYHRRAFHGWYVWVWMMGGVTVGSVLCPWQGKMYRGGPMIMGFLCGWLGGTLHGLGALRKMPPIPPDEESGDS